MTITVKYLSDARLPHGSELAVQRANGRKAVPVPQNARAAPKGTARGDDVESIRTRTTRGELSSLSHLLELTHAVGSQAECTAAEAERNRKAGLATSARPGATGQQ
jgi:hypothetical protein